MTDYSRAGRQELIDLLSVRDVTIKELREDNLTLLEENRMLREMGHNIPGWWCVRPNASGVACDTFNGEVKDRLEKCRRCDGDRRPGIPEVRVNG